MIDDSATRPRKVDWLPEGKRGAVVFTIDDVHPGTSRDAYEAGGDLGEGALGHVLWLLERHSLLEVTLFVTPDWREIDPFPRGWRKRVAVVPVLGDLIYRSPIHPRGTMRLDRHPEFVAFLQSVPRIQVGLHGLHHVHRGDRLPVEFQRQSQRTCKRMLESARQIFADAKMAQPTGMCPPGWNLPGELARAMRECGFSWVASSRDVRTGVAPDALADMTGRKGVPLYRPSKLPDADLVHFPTNFQATNPIDRAFEIIDMGGLLSIKSHIIKEAFGHIALDGMDELYRNYLDTLFSALDRRYGNSLLWTSMGALAASWRDRSLGSLS